MDQTQLDSNGHRRTKSEFKSSLLRSWIHRSRTSDEAPLSLIKPVEVIPTTPTTPSGHRSPGRILIELPQNSQSQEQAPPSPTKSTKSMDLKSPGKSLHRKGLSAISLKALAGRDNDNEEEKQTKPKRSKSSTNLGNFLSRQKCPKSPSKTAGEARAAKDKENRTPAPLITSFPGKLEARPTPIYAQFARQSCATQSAGGKFLEDEARSFTPVDPSPNKPDKQRGYFESVPSSPRPSVGTPTQTPSTTCLPIGLSVKDVEKRNGSRDMPPSAAEGGSRPTSADTRRQESVAETRPSLERQKSSAASTPKMEATLAHKNSRLHSMWPQKKAAVAALDADKSKDISIEPKDVEAEFVAMLDRRNIPESSRHKMRNLDEPIKIELIKQDWAEMTAAKNASVSTNSSRPGTGSGDEDVEGEQVLEKSVKKKVRPLSLNLSMPKRRKDPTSSPKKGRQDGGSVVHKRTKSADSTGSVGAKSFTSTSSGVASSIIARAKGQLPDDFVTYLRKVQNPENVEVGKLHKLRLLLRNETVSWTETFITSGGMAEIVALLRRILAVEWREEHEDNLLHETLLCLKALCTTALAQKHLVEIQSTLFPELIALVFGEDKKGPAEFATRNILFDLLFTHLKSAPLKERTERARTLLSQLRDPQKDEDERPVGFVLEMRRERPYKVWCREVVSVTKEVFWIFMHGLNVIALPTSTDIATSEANIHTAALALTMSEPELSVSNVIRNYGYMLTHFPIEPPPVAAAPYVGGVEWDATNYLAAHLTLLNGIMACLPTAAERNSLRELLRLSGWEKVMGVTMRTCREKFYGGVHCALRCWVAAGAADGWDVKDVRQGPCVVPRNSPAKKAGEAHGSPAKKALGGGQKAEVPRLDIPKLDLGLGGGRREGEGWL